MAQSQPYLGGYVLLYGWYKRVIGKPLDELTSDKNSVRQ